MKPLRNNEIEYLVNCRPLCQKLQVTTRYPFSPSSISFSGRDTSPTPSPILFQWLCGSAKRLYLQPPSLLIEATCVKLWLMRYRCKLLVGLLKRFLKWNLISWEEPFALSFPLFFFLLKHVLIHGIWSSGIFSSFMDRDGRM